MTGPVETGSSLAVNDEIADDRASGRLFPVSARGAFDERNFVRKAVNWALRIIGMRNLAAIRRTLQATYDEALPRVPEALKSEGFGVLSEIDLQNTLKQKLGADLRRYKILGACNPPLAYQALQAELETGLMLPCNVVVYEHNDRQAVVLAIDPTKTVAGTGNTMLVELAEAVKEKLSRAHAPKSSRPGTSRARSTCRFRTSSVAWESSRRRIGQSSSTAGAGLEAARRHEPLVRQPKRAASQEAVPPSTGRGGHGVGSRSSPRRCVGIPSWGTPVA